MACAVDRLRLNTILCFCLLQVSNMINHSDTKWAIRHSSWQCNAHRLWLISQALPPLSQSSAQPRIQTENSRGMMHHKKPTTHSRIPSNKMATRSATALAAARRQRRQQLLALLVGLLLVLSPHCVGAKLFKRRNKKAPTKSISESSDSSSSATAAAHQPAEQTCDELMARSLVKANDEKASAIGERNEALANVTTSAEKIAELEQVCAIFL